MIDYITTEDGDLKISGGDFVKGQADVNDIEKILLANPGDWKQAPTIGSGLRKQINGPQTPKVLLKIKKNIQVNLDQLKFKTTQLVVKSFANININASRP